DVTCLIIPNDLASEPAETDPPREHGSVHSSPGYTQPKIVPQEEQLKAAAEILNKGEKVAMLVGQGALHATDEVIEVAEKLGAGVAKALLGKAAVPDDLPYVTGTIGLLGTKASWNLMQGCDTLFLVGTRFPYAEFLPEEGAARGVQVDVSPRALSLRYPMEAALVGDAAETLRALLPRLREKAGREWRARVEKDVEEWWTVLEKRALRPADPMNPQRVFWELSSRLPDGCILAGDAGTSA